MDDGVCNKKYIYYEVGASEVIFILKYCSFLNFEVYGIILVQTNAAYSEIS